jgi:hypothetical protein
VNPTAVTGIVHVWVIIPAFAEPASRTQTIAIKAKILRLFMSFLFPPSKKPAKSP